MAQMAGQYVTNLGRDVCAKSGQKRKRSETEVRSAGQSELWGEELLFIAMNCYCIYTSNKDTSRKA